VSVFVERVKVTCGILPGLQTVSKNIFGRASYPEQAGNLTEGKSRVLNKIFHMGLLGIIVYRLHNLIPTFTRSSTHLQIMLMMMTHTPRRFRQSIKRPLYRRHPLDRRLGGPQIRSGRWGEEKNLAVPGPYRIPRESIYERIPLE
jgi:hypothetical protein